MENKKHPGGRPRKYTPEEFEKKFNDYIQYCLNEGQFANITGFCLFAEIDTETFYNYKDYPEFLGTIKRIEAALLNITVQKGLEMRNPAFVIFYMKNKFGWADKQEIVNSGETTVNHNMDLGGYSLEDLKDLLSK